MIAQHQPTINNTLFCGTLILEGKGVIDFFIRKLIDMRKCGESDRLDNVAVE